MTTAIEYATIHNIDITNNPSESEWKWLEDHNFDTPSVGEDGSIEEMGEWAENWEEISDNCGGENTIYAVCIAPGNEYIEFAYEFNKEDAEKGMELAIRACEEDEELLGMLKFFNGKEFAEYCHDEAEYLKEEIENNQSLEETYDSLRYPW